MYHRIGAEEVVKIIRSRKAVSKINVAHNRFGGDGFKKLFEFLSSEEGRAYEVEFLDVHNCAMNDTALRALAIFLKNNHYTRTLMLQQVR